MERAVLLRYHEIALKGQNRKWFERRLIQNAQKIIQREIGTKINVTQKRGRILLHTPWNPQVKTALSHVFGISSFSPMRMVETNWLSLEKAANEEVSQLLKDHPSLNSFRVLTRRSEKALGENSMEIDKILGAAILKNFPFLKVSLKNPEFRVGVEIRNESSYLWTDKNEGLGGLPVGTNGHLLCLLSGGLDSPIAALQMLKRGTQVSFIHFYGTPFVESQVLEKIEDLVTIINRYQPKAQPLYVIPFGKIQEKIALVTHPRLRTVLYRRMMVRISCELSKKINAQALVTGESLGQVASQTIENLSNIESVSSLPILRPLIGFDKSEIIKYAEKWGTYETSIRPSLDCCTLFADRHPATKSTSSQLEREEARFPVEEFIAEALGQIL